MRRAQRGGPVRIEIVTIFPEMFAAVRDFGIPGRAVRGGALALSTRNPREFATDRHGSVDDRPYGGGPGMVMMAPPLAGALRAARQALPPGSPAIYLTPRGERLTQRIVGELARLPGMVLLCGRYEGVDERLLEVGIDRELSIGDFVLSGGEPAAMVLVDAVARLLPGVVGNEASLESESFMQGLLDWPHYTRPERFEGRGVPEVLTTGNHAAIRRWRLKQALGQTWLRRPELIGDTALDDEQRELLEEFRRERDDTTKE